ncbi:SUF system NifU family Fe-S cluster assembly protein [Melissococcus plutonius]|uniref:Putative iron-sulfur cluster assembly scaffold protein for SUF system, SufE2 n=1 Tax=Melissococcus plutonius TaxID=33970 RepID=A0A2Z5Y1I3_9ENTE|nr:SUF system NifU family Fe-S cluster assembly protein [Melissococcus plutonius]BAL61782.1 putative iron-sulfur cluster assembly scaffold protein for SUF system, SufE2 [Melissococcus plutonius DAT561]MCV2498271.1 SUF system NifU family Fe-S cluster assembly protein [Melissococcus plutonius]MCV2501615.1 SUF system NifU family Fe-S cluster assembly protein [Melissococcus plutonius]MCV2504618.1 SUF system NifU family Fe-S cluster assembly protein [Melissococcus plutonius]MCV2506886.1 SUF system 
MALSKLDNLYRQIILDYSSHPHHYGTLKDSSEKIEMNNPTCGDVIQLEVKIENNTISDIAFTGSGCSISTASASMMTDVVLGKSVEEAEHLAVVFAQMVQGTDLPEADLDALGDAATLQGVAKFPARIKCSTLAWKALGKALTNENGQATENHSHKKEE